MKNHILYAFFLTIPILIISCNDNNISNQYQEEVNIQNSDGVNNWSENRTFGVSVSGPSQLTQQDGIAWFTAEIDGGSPPYEYEWESRIGSGNWYPSGTHETVSITYSPTIHWFYVRVTITDSNDISVTSLHHSMQFYHQ